MEKQLTMVKEFKKSKLFNNQGLNIAVLNGTFREMGIQYGELLKETIINCYQEIVIKQFVDSKIFTYEQLIEYVGEPYWNGYSKRQQELTKGMSIATGLTTYELTLLNQNMNAVFIARKLGFFSTCTVACTSMAAWGDYTIDHELYTMRNLDFHLPYKAWAEKYATLLVCNPSDGSNQVAGFTFSGMIIFFDAMNDKGIYSQQNTGTGTEGNIIYSNRPSIFDELVNAMFDSDNLKTFETRINMTRASFPLTIMGASPEEVFYLENATIGFKKRSVGVEDEVIVAVNQFYDPSWGVTPLPYPSGWLSETRRENILQLAKVNKGKIDRTIMEEILNVPLFDKNGVQGKGASVLDENPTTDVVTVWQVISHPAKRKFVFRIPKFTDWLIIDLNDLFNT
ncbi:MAG TPA: C45 family autoproteolytic acyltransferase/hydrolase [Victivallales bacterium]|nr:C45 family autoproteolytic acyltransferase/hydrolase [Victivallales bacterium]